MIRVALAAALLLGVAACGESIALDPAGVEVVDETGESLGEAGPVRLRGAPECGADTVAIIEIEHPLGDLEPGEKRIYVRDPDSVIPPRLLEAPYDHRSSLDSDTRFTGYETDRFTIWLGPDSDQYIYLVDGPRVEAWPRVDELDCSGFPEAP